MYNPKVSVIVPTYNAEKFLNQCLNTIIGQTLEDIEIICVNDGSVDNSLNILEEYEKKDSRISVITQTNSNGGVARNTGLKKATGEYVVFWDADDFFELDALEKMVNQIEIDSADICISNADRYNDITGQFNADIKYIVPSKKPEAIPFNRNTIPDTIFNVSNNVPWNKLYRRAFIIENQLMFQDIQRSNDTYFVMMAIALAHNITIIDEKLMHYRYNNAGSLTGSLSASPLLPIEAYRKTKDELERRGVFDLVKKSFVNRVIGGMLYVLENQKSIEGFHQVFDYISNGGFLELGLEREEESSFHYSEKYREYQYIRNRDYVSYFLTKREVTKTEFEKNQNKLVDKYEKKVFNLQKKYDDLKMSPTWKAGRILTYIPGKIKRLITRES